MISPFSQKAFTGKVISVETPCLPAGRRDKQRSSITGFQFSFTVK
jgi:hypothetical protein